MEECETGGAEGGSLLILRTHIWCDVDQCELFYKSIKIKRLRD